MVEQVARAPQAVRALHAGNVHAGAVPRPHRPHILAFEGDSQVVFFSGNCQEYEADKRKRLGEEGAKPKRLRFEPLKM